MLSRKAGPQVIAQVAVASRDALATCNGDVGMFKDHLFPARDRPDL